MKKVCTKCGINKALEEYYKRALKKDGKQSECKSCHDVMQEKYNKSDKGKLTHAKYDKSDKGKLANAKASVKYFKTDKGKAVQAEYRKSDKGKLAHAKGKAKYKKSDKGKLKMVEYRKSDKGKAAKARGNHNTRYWKSKTLNTLDDKEFNCIIFLQNYTCPCCGRYFDEVEPQRDHIYPVSKGGDFIKENIQALCGSCNSKKRIKYIDYRSEIHKEMIAVMV